MLGNPNEPGVLIQQVLNLVVEGLSPYVDAQLRQRFGPDWRTKLLPHRPSSKDDTDARALLRLVTEHWNDVFRAQLRPFEHGLVHELMEVGAGWACEPALPFDDAFRVLDSAHRLLSAIGAAGQVRSIVQLKEQLWRLRWDSQAAPKPRPRTARPQTHAEEILDAAAALVMSKGQQTFSRQEVREQLGVSQDRWRRGYTALFQAMRADHPGHAPSIANRLKGVFRRVSRGRYTLTDYGRSLIAGSTSHASTPDQ